jgi:hypothetical protein
MCKDRNKKLAKFIEGMGLNKEYLGVVIKNNRIDSSTKMAFLDIYFEIYANQDPFIPFRKAQNKCYIFEHLNRYDMHQKICAIFKQYSEPIDIEKATVEFDEYIVPFMQQALLETSRAFASNAIQKQDALIYKLLISFVRVLYNATSIGFIRI